LAEDLKHDMAAILLEGKDMTLATLQPDGAPQATTVSYASDGEAIFFGCAESSRKAQNLARDHRVSITINLPYQDWAQIRGLSISGRARQLSDGDDIARAGVLFMAKYPEIAQYVSAPGDELAIFRVEPEIVSILDYRKGFGHTALLRLDAPAAGPVGE
jgi:nitroimidazol reductase NimA-like FMN-containing flavoprotein (pyridoxamine 5'-phosphate oxidase superfamily)